ncbi:sigma-54 interaction domain-containing protein [Desulfosoma caldarium]|uniref:PAS domain S-box-containing protein n=1 Tax=Desulfosoma caldarium TaxID=610254 RepID=A0A3N1UKA7_9BACT|nr:sigma 54-interacting transcriptional regulator [Desulfosoma caldarium]ROQ89809.1 PAS domain S-box-containing protein [Desulfosoma caldarium]
MADNHQRRVTQEHHHMPAIQRHLEDIVNTMNDGLMVVGPDGSLLLVNDALCRMIGYRRDELLGRSCTLLDCDSCEGILRHGGTHWCRLFTLGNIHHKRCVVMRKDGSYVSVLKNAAVLKDDKGDIIAAVETLTDISELDRKDEQIVRLSRLLDSEKGFRGIIGLSPPMQKVFDLTEKAAQSDAPVIIYGESGTGKELIARAIHDLGPHREGPYIQVNCAALNESLLESELFGHVKGAFTGATSHREGRFEAANGGDIFLDEIGDVPLSIQVKLLRVLENKTVERVGDHRPIRVDVRIITATNRDLPKMVREGTFREDFFYRINVIPIYLPPLRQRMEDLPLLVDFFLEQHRRKGKRVQGVHPQAMAALMAYRWPGNVRELKSTLEYACVVTEDGLIRPEHLPPHVMQAQDVVCTTRTAPSGFPQKSTVDAQKPHRDRRQELIDALRRTGGNQSEAARILGISRVTVWNRMKRYQIDLRKVIAE